MSTMVQWRNQVFDDAVNLEGEFQHADSTFLQINPSFHNILWNTVFLNYLKHGEI